jgi:hypothetical protein
MGIYAPDQEKYRDEHHHGPSSKNMRRILVAIINLHRHCHGHDSGTDQASCRNKMWPIRSALWRSAEALNTITSPMKTNNRATVNSQPSTLTRFAIPEDHFTTERQRGGQIAESLADMLTGSGLRGFLRRGQFESSASA